MCAAASSTRPGWRWLQTASAAIALTVAGAAPAHTSEEVPFITTPDAVTRAMLQLARVKRTDFVIDLGSGDGRIVILAAQRFGARGLGVEIDPTLAKACYDRGLAHEHAAQHDEALADFSRAIELDAVERQEGFGGQRELGLDGLFHAAALVHAAGHFCARVIPGG